MNWLLVIAVSKIIIKGISPEYLQKSLNLVRKQQYEIWLSKHNIRPPQGRIILAELFSLLHQQME